METQEYWGSQADLMVENVFNAYVGKQVEFLNTGSAKCIVPLEDEFCLFLVAGLITYLNAGKISYIYFRMLALVQDSNTMLNYAGFLFALNGSRGFEVLNELFNEVGVNLDQDCQNSYVDIDKFSVEELFSRLEDLLSACLKMDKADIMVQWEGETNS
ncbi:hypothetical protein [Paucidesulfovibrio longus]|uniref:hypothetical protein n=1 Tax=Paucidesulfovibrio longus TaxID=889 RepID=UPI00058EA9DE|nr:hypothetical protein [Paucidesulfovibrio longus]